MENRKLRPPIVNLEPIPKTTVYFAVGFCDLEAASFERLCEHNHSTPSDAADSITNSLWYGLHEGVIASENGVPRRLFWGEQEEADRFVALRRGKCAEIPSAH